MSTNLSMTSLLSTILAYWVLQRVELTTVAEYPAAAVPRRLSLTKVALLLLKIQVAAGIRMPKKVVYVQKLIVLVSLLDLNRV